MPENSGYVRDIGTARKWGKAPLEFINKIAEPQYAWTPLDYALASAHEIIESERCPQCGIVAWHAYSSNSNIRFEIEDHTCESCMVLDRHNDDMKEKKPGVTPTIKTSTYDDSELPSREDWFEELNSKYNNE